LQTSYLEEEIEDWLIQFGHHDHEVKS